MRNQTASPIGETITLNQLLSNEILTEDGKELAITADFLNEVENIQASLGTGTQAVRSRMEKATEIEKLRDGAEKISEPDRTSIAVFLALRGRLNFSESTCAQLSPVIDQLLRGQPESSGTPVPFLPIRGEFLHLLIPALQQGIIYIWRRNCDPCDLVKNDFEEYFVDPPSDMALFAVYGPEWIDDVQEYDVAAAPTILFLRNGRIDTRLVGAFPEKTLITEIEKSRELA